MMLLAYANILAESGIALLYNLKCLLKNSIPTNTMASVISLIKKAYVPPSEWFIVILFLKQGLK